MVGVYSAFESTIENLDDHTRLKTSRDALFKLAGS